MLTIEKDGQGNWNSSGAHSKDGPLKKGGSGQFSQKSHLEKKLARTVTRYRTPTRRGSERDQDTSLKYNSSIAEPIWRNSPA